MDRQPQMVHSANGVGGGIDGHLNGIFHELTNEMANIAIESGREKHGLITAGATTQNPLNLGSESIIGHAIGFIENGDFNIGHIDLVRLQ